MCEWCNSRLVNPSAAAIAAWRFANANARQMAATCLKLAADNEVARFDIMVHYPPPRPPPPHGWKEAPFDIMLAGAFSSGQTGTNCPSRRQMRSHDANTFLAMLQRRRAL